MNKGKKEIQFRQQALENINQPARLDESLRVISAKSWLLLIVCFLVLGTFLGWLFFGTISLRVKAYGILLSTTNTIETISAPEQGGYIKTIHVHSGQHIKKNMLLFTLNNQLLLNEISIKIQYLNKLYKQKQQLTNLENTALTKQKKLLKENIDKLQESLDEANSKLVQVKKLMSIKEDAYKKGIVTIDALTEVKISYYNLLQEIRSHEAALVQTKASINDFVDKWQERQRSFSNKILDVQADIEILKNRWKSSNQIHSSTSGIITEVQVKENDYVVKGQVLISIIPSNQNLYALVFIPANKGKNVKVNMSAQIIPTEFDKLEFGSIKGTVLSVSEFPSTYNYMIAILKNPNLVNSFLKKGSVFSITIKLKRDKNTVSGYAWNTSNGKNSTISQGTLVEASITTKEVKPIMLFIPAIEYLYKS